MPNYPVFSARLGFWDMRRGGTMPESDAMPYHYFWDSGRYQIQVSQAKKCVILPTILFAANRGHGIPICFAALFASQT